MATLHKFKLGENYNKNFIVFSRLAKDSLGPTKIFRHFCKGAKMYNQSFRLGLLRRNGSD